MIRLRLLLALCIFLLATSASATNDWALERTSAVVDGGTEDMFQYRTANLTDSEGLDVSYCTAGVKISYLRNVTTPSQGGPTGSALSRARINFCAVATGAMSAADCVEALGPTQTLEISGQPSQSQYLIQGDSPDREAVAQGSLGPISGPPGNTGLSARGLVRPPAGRPYLRVQGVVSPGGTTTLVQATCRHRMNQTPLWRLMQAAYYNTTEINFQDVRHTSCNNAACTPNDPLTPFWVRNLIGAATADTFTASSAWQETGGGIIDPGGTNTTGVQYSLPGAQSLVLDTSNRFNYPGKAPYLRATIWRTGATIISFVGLCTVALPATPDLAITAAGAVSTGAGFIWKTNGAFDVVSGNAVRATTSKTFAGGYTQLEIRSEFENIAVDGAGNLEVDDSGSSPSTDTFSWQFLINGQVVYRHPDDLPTAVDLGSGTKQLTPCVAVVNSGGTADNLRIEDIDWMTPKRQGRADDN